MKKHISYSLCLLAAVACSGKLDVTKVDAVTKVFPFDTEYATCPNPIEVARGENATLQFVVKATDSEISGLRISEVKLPKGAMKLRTAGPVFSVTSHYFDYWDRDTLGYLPENHLFPDPIITDSTMTVPQGECRSLWLDIDVPAETEPGTYTVKARIESAQGSCVQKVKVKVYPVTLTPQRLLVTNWMGVDLRYLNGGEAPVSGLYTEMLTKLYKMAGEYGNNCWRIEGGASPTLDEKGNVTGWDFSAFDGEVELIIANAPLAQIHGMHFGGRGDWVSHMKFRGKSADDPELKKWIYSYFPALQQHLKEKTLPDGRPWLDIFAQFIADEPIDFCLEDWEAVARMIKDAAPEIKTIEAYRSSTWDRSLLDYPCPQLDEFAERPIFAGLSREDNVWFYTCMFPRNTYANRFLEQELLKPRILHWINYKYNAIGYLHWGLNYWGGGHGTPYGDVSNPASDWPAGDSHIIYPGYHKFYPSIRYCAMRDGIRDYELLRMVEDKDPQKAAEFVNRVVLDYNKYDTNPADFRAVRHDILEYLSE